MSISSTIACGFDFTLCVNNNGVLFGFGDNSNFKLGFKDGNEISIPTPISSVTNIMIVSCGYDHSVCVTRDGIVFTFGDNINFQLGCGKDTRELTRSYIPQQVNVPPIRQVSCGTNFTICLSDENELYSFGCNSNGQLGIGHSRNCKEPQKINISNVEFVECGGEFVICKLISDEFYLWGKSQLGNEKKNTYNLPQLCNTLPNNIISLKSGINHSLILLSNGTVLSFGANEYGQLGYKLKEISSTPTLISTLPEIQRIECGYDTSFCVDVDNKLWCFGLNIEGQLGLGDRENRYTPTLNNSLENICYISHGGDHTFVKTTNNEIFAFGINNKSQFGCKTNNREGPIQVLKDNGDIWGTYSIRDRQKSARKI